jgi:uncharacterized protein
MSVGARRVGVGALLNPSMTEFVARSLDRLDYLAVIPDRGWIDNGVGASPRFHTLPAADAFLDHVGKRLPIVLHGIGLSICSAEIFDETYALELIASAERSDSPWISEHLAFSRVGSGHEINAAILAPTPYDRELMDLLAPRARFFAERLSKPFLLENNVYYFRYLDQDYSEEEFLNVLCDRTGCRVLLDLHNLYTNSVNHHFDARDYLRRLDLANVLEIHIAGGAPMMGFHTDSHTGPPPEPVWTLLEHVIPLAANLRGVTFEFHESSFGLMGDEGILEQIERARDIVGRRIEPAQGRDVASIVSAGAG